MGSFFMPKIPVSCFYRVARIVDENGGIEGGITMIYRPLYVDTPFAKNFTGVHRCGKSTIHKMSVTWSFTTEDTL
jgi:hypothetical protein